MKIHTGANGVETTAIMTDEDGVDIEGHRYQIAFPGFFQTLNFQRGGVATAGVEGKEVA